MYTLEITESAESDLDQITDYIGNVLANPPAASALLDEIERVSNTLETAPEIFPLCSDSRQAAKRRGSRVRLALCRTICRDASGWPSRWK